jgi:hypothetical protein
MSPTEELLTLLMQQAPAYLHPLAGPERARCLDELRDFAERASAEPCDEEALRTDLENFCLRHPALSAHLLDDGWRLIGPPGGPPKDEDAARESPEQPVRNRFRDYVEALAKDQPKLPTAGAAEGGADAS